MTLSGTNTWLLDGAVPTLVDAGIGDEAAQRDGGAPRPPRIGAPADHPRPCGSRVRHRRHRASLAGASMFADGPGRGSRARDLGDGQWVEAGDGRLQVIYTPGHAPDHVCFWDPVTRDLCGDMVIHGTTVMIPARRGRQPARISSRSIAWRRSSAADPWATDRSSSVRSRRSDLSASPPRTGRAGAGVLAEGVTSVDDIVARLYRGLPAPCCRPLARRSRRI